MFEQSTVNGKAEINAVFEAGCASRGYDFTKQDQGHLMAVATLVSLGTVDVLKGSVATGMPLKASAIQKLRAGSPA